MFGIDTDPQPPRPYIQASDTGLGSLHVIPFAAPAEFGAGDVQLTPLVVWALLAGSGFLVLFFTGLLAWWFHRRADRAVRADRRDRRTADSARSRAVPEDVQELTALRAAAARAATVAAHARHD